MSSKVVDKLHSATTVNETGHVVMLDRQPSSKPEDVKIGQVDGYCPNDIVIAVMGITGSGKSTFIQMMTGKEVKTSADLASCTSEVAVFSCPLSPTSNLWLVDTPGFDDTKLSDMRVLETVATFLGEVYFKKNPLNGIIYLHRISDVRLQGSALKNLRIFRKLCGTDNLSSVVLATTMWSKVTPSEGEARELELKTKDDFWGTLIRKGCTLMRHSNDHESARQIVDYIVNLHHPIVLDIQKEMIDKNMNLDETSAGMEVEAELQEAKKHHKEEMAQIEIEKQEALAAKEYEFAAELDQLSREHELKLKDKENESLALKMNFEELMQRKEEQNRLAQHKMFELQLQHQALQDKQKQDEMNHAADMERLKQNQELEVQREKARNEEKLFRLRFEATDKENAHKLDLIKQEKEIEESRRKREQEIEQRKATMIQQQQVQRRKDEEKKREHELEMSRVKSEAQAEQARREWEARREEKERESELERDKMANERAMERDRLETERSRRDPGCLVM